MKKSTDEGLTMTNEELIIDLLSKRGIHQNKDRNGVANEAAQVQIPPPALQSEQNV
jgi:hypothetical protein